MDELMIDGNCLILSS